MNTLVLVLLAAPVAWTDRADWPSPISTPQQFDRASRAEVLAFSEALAQLPFELRGSALARAVGLKHGDTSAALAWRRRTEHTLIENFVKGMEHCGTGEVLCPAAAPASWSELAASATPMLESLPTEYAAWRHEARRFHSILLHELVRLALLSSTPTTSNESALLDDNEEAGDAFSDRQFLLTFDDGPTGARGETDALLPVLESLGQHALFFVVGDAVRARRPAAGLYGGHCVGSHGSSHRSHVSAPAVASQLTDWNAELATLTGPVRWFRPPYGQRTPEFSRSLAMQKTGVLLWNIDSQDWQAPTDLSLLSGRVVTLMLLQRRGVLLFHDVHPVARRTLPTLVATFGESVSWLDCRLVAPACSR